MEVPKSSPVTPFTARGYSVMKASNVTILGVAKGVAHQLPYVLRQVEKLSALFQYSRTIFVEGDSEDETLLLLRSLSSPHFPLTMDS